VKSRRRQNCAGEFAKRVVDAAVSFTLLAVLAPLLAAIALAIAFNSPGPVLYAGERVGRRGRRFRILKFRTMRADAERSGPSSTSEDDPRITRPGRFLRRYKLDELPQLINVLRGEMSLVGPRPQVPWAVELYTPEQRELLTVRPGITDWASLRFRNEGEILRGSPDPDRDYLEKIAPEKIRLGLEYVRRRSLRTDLEILALTVKTLLTNGS
jgi:lipopolysaccharide/colanic/teichoic acid biosynthesis glycosyltransferase